MEYWILQYSAKLLRPGYPYPSGIPQHMDYWHISRYDKDIGIGDVAFVWQAGSPQRRGIYNVSEIVSVSPHNPTAQRQIALLQQSDNPYWNDKAERDRLRQQPSVLIRNQYTSDLQPPLLINELKHQGFGNLPIIKMALRGIYSLDTTIGRRLIDYIRRTRGV